MITPADPQPHAPYRFVNGFVHADPHPGNLLVRQRPDKPSRPQIVLIDRGSAHCTPGSDDTDTSWQMDCT